MNIAYFYMTGQGEQLVRRLCSIMPGKLFDKTTYKEGIQQQWERADALVFVMAAGIVVRKIAPYIQSKTTDPAVLVLDQNGQFVISLLSGHLGGANALAVRLAEICGGTPVITTATDVAKVPAMDVFAKENGLVIENIEKLKYVSGALIEEQPVTIITERSIEGSFPKNVTVFETDIDDEFQSLTIKSDDFRKKPDKKSWGQTAAAVVIAKDCSVYADLFPKSTPVLYLRLRPYVVGVGCKRGMEKAVMWEAFNDFWMRQWISKDNIGALATIELKKDELCIQALARSLEVPLLIYTKTAIEAVDLEDAGGQRIEASDFVRSVTGVGSVCEACAYLGAGGGKILAGKTKYSGITFALAENREALKL